MSNELLNQYIKADDPLGRNIDLETMADWGGNEIARLRKELIKHESFTQMLHAEKEKLRQRVEELEAELQDARDVIQECVDRVQPLLPVLLGGLK